MKTNNKPNKKIDSGSVMIICITIIFITIVLFGLVNVLYENDRKESKYVSLTVKECNSEVYHVNGKCSYSLFDGNHVIVYDENRDTIFESFSDDKFSVIVENIDTETEDQDKNG